MVFSKAHRGTNLKLVYFNRKTNGFNETECCKENDVYKGRMMLVYLCVTRTHIKQEGYFQNNFWK